MKCLGVVVVFLSSASFANGETLLKFHEEGWSYDWAFNCMIDINQIIVEENRPRSGMSFTGDLSVDGYIFEMSAPDDNSEWVCKTDSVGSIRSIERVDRAN